MIRAATGILAAIVMVAAPASAEWVVESGPIGHGTTNAASDPISITQNQDPTSVASMVACGDSQCTPDGVVSCTTENHWGRFYDLDSAHSINDAFDIQSVDIGHVVSVHEDPGMTNTLEVNLYTVDEPNGFSTANTNSIGGTSIQVPGDGSANGTLENVAVAGTVDDPNTKDLAVEQFAPEDGTVAPLRAYRAGGNGLGEFADSYLYSASCALNDWTAFAAIGFGQIHLVQVVNGKPATSIPTETASWGEIKALFDAD